MRRNALYALVILVAIWIILMESISLFTILSGIVIGVLCLWFSRKFIPQAPLQDVRFHRLPLYFLYLIGQIYIQGFLVIKMILTGGVRVDIVEAKTELKSDFLRAILISSVTLTPGSVPLGLEGETMMVLNLGSAKGEDPFEVVQALQARLEKRLIKAQK